MPAGWFEGIKGEATHQLVAICCCQSHHFPSASVTVEEDFGPSVLTMLMHECDGMTCLNCVVHDFSLQGQFSVRENTVYYTSKVYLIQDVNIIHSHWILSANRYLANQLVPVAQLHASQTCTSRYPSGTPCLLSLSQSKWSNLLESYVSIADHCKMPPFEYLFIKIRLKWIFLSFSSLEYGSTWDAVFITEDSNLYIGSTYIGNHYSKIVV